MAFDGEKFVQDLREELEASGRGLDKAIWVEKVVQGEATPRDLVGWARQHYWGVTYHTRRVLSAWVTRIPYEMTDDVIENLAEEVLGTQSKTGLSHLHWLFEFTPRARRPRRGHHTRNAQRGGDRVRELPLQPRESAPLVRAHVRGHPRHREPDPARVHPGGRGVQDPLRRRPLPRRLPLPHDPHLRGRGARWPRREFAERYLDTEDKRRSARAAYLAGAELTRRCWDATDGATW